MTTPSTPTQESKNTDATTVTLSKPIQRGDTTIKQVTLIKPNAGALRGVNLLNVMQVDVNALITLLPRVTDPALIENEVLALDPDDLFSLGSEVATFLLPSDVKSQFMTP